MSKTYTLEETKKMKRKTDVDFFKKTIEKDIMEQSISDPDAPYLTDEELKEFASPEERKKNYGAKKTKTLEEIKKVKGKASRAYLVAEERNSNKRIQRAQNAPLICRNAEKEGHE